MKTNLFLILLFPIASLFSDEHVTVAETFQGMVKIENGKYNTKFGTVTFSDGFVFETTIYELKLIGTIKSDDKYPFIIMSGRSCFECCMNTSIYIHLPKDGRMDGQAEKDVFFYPGELIYYEDGELIRKSRAFYGEILPGITGVIWYLNDKQNNNIWKENVFLFEIIGNNTIARYLNELPKIETTLKLVSENKATEIKGMRLTSEP